MFGDNTKHYRYYICKADFVLFIASFLSECLCLSKLVFYDEKRTWNEAYSICTLNGGFPVTVDSQDKYDVISTFSTQTPWNSIDKVDKSPVWIGLHVTDSDGIEKAWADCAQYSWTKWHPSQPNNPNVNRCVYLQKLTANFWMDPCNTPHYFICENIDANPCISPTSSCYEATLGVTGQVVQNNSDNKPLTTCNNGMTTSISTAAGPSTQSTVITTETSSIHLTLNSLQQVTSSNIPTGAQYFTSEESSTQSQSTLGSTSVSMTNSVQTSSTEKSSTQSQSTLGSTLISMTNSVKTTSSALNNALEYTTISVAECICTCVNDGANITESELKNKIETRKRVLEVNKSSLSSTIRKKESAYDSRISAKGIGYVGVTFITFIVGGIVLMDLHNLYVFIGKKHSATKSQQERTSE